MLRSPNFVQTSKIFLGQLLVNGMAFQAPTFIQTYFPVEVDQAKNRPLSDNTLDIIMRHG